MKLTKDTNVVEFNKEAWNQQVRRGNRWTVPVSAEEVARAKKGDWGILLTPNRPVPHSWFGELKGKRVLGLASGGGQQGPILAALGARVTIFDNSPEQLKRDQEVAAREGFEIKTVEGDMRDLSCFADETFDLIFHPCSNSFVDTIRPVWKECARVLKPGGALLAGFTNPVLFSMDLELQKRGISQLKYPLPYSDLDHLEDPSVQEMIQGGEPLSFGHTLEDQIGGQLDAGFMLTHLFEDGWEDAPEPIHKLMKPYLATRAVRQSEPK